MHILIFLILHLLDFRTDDGLGLFVYKQYDLRGQVQEILEKKFYDDSCSGFYLTTGRALPHYNNAAQTKRTASLLDKHSEDMLLASLEDEGKFGDKVILKSQYGETEVLNVRYTEKVRPKTLFCTFHHAKSRINAIFGDESDELILTARFKSVKVDVVAV